MLQVVIPKRHRDELDHLLREIEPDRVWHTELTGDLRLATVLLRADATQELSDALEDQFESLAGFRMVLLPAEATRPKLPEKAPPPPADPVEAKPAKRPWWKVPRISREELEEDVASAARPDLLFLVMTLLATVVAAVGLLRGSPAIIIGAMVIAPLLGPNMALAIGTTLGDLRVIRRALLCNVLGGGLAVAVSAGIGAVQGVSPETSAEIASRTGAGVGDVALAVASGAAGAIAFTTGVPAALVGVMVAVALLPPTVTAGMLLGAGEIRASLGALTLVAVNVASVNLAATLVFLWKDVRPKSWFGAERARAAVARAIPIWLAILAALVVLLIYSG